MILALTVLVPAARVEAEARDVHIMVLISQDAPPYEEALAGFRENLEHQGMHTTIDVVTLHGDPVHAEAALQRAHQERVGLLLTLGSIATQAAVREVRDIPIVAGLIMNADDVGKAENVACVVLEFPVETEFRWLQRLLPGQKSVGVLFNSSENQARIDAAARVARAIGLSLHSRKVESPRELPEALDSLANRADVLWGVADQVVLTPQTARPILLFSLRNHIPFVGLSETWVKAGALYALDRDYNDIGMQCGDIAIRILQGATPSSLPPRAPRKVVYSINLKTARLMKLQIPVALVQGAQDVVE